MSNFRDYQLSDLNNHSDNVPEEKDALLKTAIQEDGTVSVMTELERNENLTLNQLALLREITDTFNLQDSAADLAILYEVTGFKAEADTYEFWESYGDFEEPGGSNMVSDSRNEEVLAQKRNKQVADAPNST